MLADTNSWTILSRIDDRPAGFALSRMIVDEAELLLIGVSPSYRGRGIGRKLIDEVARTAALRGAKRLHLEVRDGNAATIPRSVPAQRESSPTGGGDDRPEAV